MRREIKIIKFFETFNSFFLLLLLLFETTSSRHQRNFPTPRSNKLLSRFVKIFSELKIRRIKKKKKFRKLSRSSKIVIRAPNSQLNGSSGEGKILRKIWFVISLFFISPYLSVRISPDSETFDSGRSKKRKGKG